MNERLSLQDLIDLLAKKQEITKKDAESFLREFIVVISENIENNEPVKIKDFGVFKLVKVNARRSVDVNTGEAIEIAAHYKLSFTPDKSLKEAINRPFAHFESVVLEEGVSFDNIEKEEIFELEADEPESIIDDKPEGAGGQPSEGVAISSMTLQDIVNTQDVTEHIGETVPPVDETTEVELPEEIAPEEPQSPPTDNISFVADIEYQQTEIIEALTPRLPEEKASQESKEDMEAIQAKREKASKKRRRLISLGFFIFLIIAGFFVGGLYFQEIAKYLTEGPVGENTKTTIAEHKSPDEAIFMSDSSATDKTDSLSTHIDTIPNQIEATEKTIETGLNTTSTALATITIEPGSTLRNIALKYYGHKSFWVYIYKENKDKIKNINNVPLGTKLVIPFPVKYGINPQDKASVDTAKQMEQKLFSEMGL